MRTNALYLIVFFVILAEVFADIQSTSGNIRFDVDSDNQSEISIDTTGLGIGTDSASANLHVLGNASIENGNIGIGTTATNSSLEIQGSIGFNIQSLSSNTTLKGNSIVLVDTSSDNILVTLPYAGNVTGRTYNIKKSSSLNKLWIAGGGNAIDQTGTLELSTAGQALPAVELVSDGVQWYVTSSVGGTNTIAADNLIGWWKLDETSGNTASNAVTGGNAGTLNEGFTFSGNGAEGRIGKCLDFDGNDNHIDQNPNNTIATLGNYDANTGFTISSWINSTESAVNGKVFDLRKASASTLFGPMLLASGKILFQYRTDNSAELASGNYPSFQTVNDGAWHHIGLVRSGNQFDIYIDGTLDKTGTDGSNFNTLSADELTIGAVGAGGSKVTFFDGMIDDVRIYDRALNSSEMQALFQQGE